MESRMRCRGGRGSTRADGGDALRDTGGVTPRRVADTRSVREGGSRCSVVLVLGEEAGACTALLSAMMGVGAVELVRGRDVGFSDGWSSHYASGCSRRTVERT